MAPAFNFTTLIDAETNDFGYLTADGSDSENATGLSNGEWTVKWNDYGAVKGASMCSSMVDGPTIDGTPAAITDENADVGCWCKMTGWTPNSGTETPAASLWAFINTRGSAADCAGLCANDCSNYVYYYSSLRSLLFGSVQ